MKIKYRPELDGLRALAVLAVMIYHTDDKLLRGGYIGVDIFFVISGFLITSIILKEININSKFSFYNFYERRFRRIIPALIIVIFFSIIASWFILTPTSFVELAKSIQYTLLFSSNFFFYFSEIEYAAESSLLKPLLHTWSLAIEEQYYLLFPILIYGIKKYFKKYLSTLLIIFFFISLAIANYLAFYNPSLNFFMLQTRGWELIAGSFLAYIKVIKIKNNNFFVSNLITFSSFVIIILSFIYFNDNILHPSILTTLPVISTCLIIHFSNENNIIKKILSIKIFVFIGLISYSLYLWHYPIFSFARHLNMFDTALQKISFFLLTVFFSILSYFLVEKRCRDKKIKFKKIFITFIFFIIIIFVSSNIIINKQGYYKRDKIISNFGIKINDYVLDQGYYIKNHFFNFSKNYVPDNFKNNDSKMNILFVGNSFSISLVQSLEFNKNLFKDFNFNLISPIKRTEKINYSVGCFEKFLISNQFFCEESGFDFTDNILKQYSLADLIILSTRWDQDNIDSLKNIISTLKSNNKKILIINMPLILEPFTFKGINLYDYFVLQNRRLPESNELMELEKIVFRDLNNSNYFLNLRKINDDLEKFSKLYNIKILKTEDFQCDKINKRCFLTDGNSKKLYIDDMHFTNEGASFFGKLIYEKQWFDID